MHPFGQALRLAHINDLVPGIMHDVHAGTVGQLF